MLQGTLLFGLAAIWSALGGSPKLAKAAKYCAIIGPYGNWIGSQLAAFWSARALFSLTGKSISIEVIESPGSSVNGLALMSLFLKSDRPLICVSRTIQRLSTTHERLVVFENGRGQPTSESAKAWPQIA